MKFQVQDVGHGFCAEIRASNGNLLLIDCGYGDKWTPSKRLDRRVSLLVVSNYDQDHIADLPDVRSKLGVDWLVRNMSVNAADLRRIKLEQCGFVTAAMESMLEMMGTYQPRWNQTDAGLVAAYQPNIVHPGVTLQHFWNGIGEFGDTNNLSVVTFVDMMGHRFVFGGDMEKPGWKSLLRQESFRKALAGVTVFIASHHGRESGYAKELFDVATQVQVVVISDCEKKYDSQDMSAVYATHASGATFGGVVRKVLSTRNDGSIWWQTQEVARAA